MSYLHHIIFDPLSAWEKFKIDMTVGIVVSVLVVLFVGYWEIRANTK
jgi:hypothetical protein